MKVNWEYTEEQNNNLKELLSEEINCKNMDLIQKIKKSKELCERTRNELRDVVAKLNSFSTKEINRISNRSKARINFKQ